MTNDTHFDVQQKQNYLDKNSVPIYLYSSTAVVLYGGTAIFITGLLIMVYRKFKAQGFAVWLLYALQVSLLFGFAGYLERLFCLIRFINTPSDDVVQLHSSFLALVKGERWFEFLTSVTNVCQNEVHWIFAIKYWSLAAKLELIKKGQDPDKFDRRFQIYMWCGVAITLVIGSVQG